jgi:CBS domain-containing protein
MNNLKAPNRGRRVSDVMTSPPITVVPTTPFKEIVSLLTTNRISAVPVVDADGRPIGIVSEADLLLKEANPNPQQGRHLFDTPARRRDLVRAAGLVASDLMSSPVHTVLASAGLGEAARLLHDRGVKRLAVVDEDSVLVGIVSRGDALTAFLRPDADLVTDIREEVMVRTLWMDPNLVSVTAVNGVVNLQGVVDRRSDIPILTRLIGGVDGVVGLTTTLTFRFDDTRGMEMPSLGLPHLN